MFIKQRNFHWWAGLVAACLVSSSHGADVESGFNSLFDGESLDGWNVVAQRGEGFGVKDGVIYCAQGGGGNLLTERQYSDFIFRFEFKLEEGSNNGVAIRAPMQGNPAYMGMELQILDNTADKWANLRPAQYHGSIYDVVPAKRGALKQPGEWNEEEIICRGRKVKVVLNGQTIVDADLNEITDPAVLAKHPGLLRRKGHIGFLGHNDYVEFRNLRVKELPSAERDNTAPDGFVALFNGENLAGWKGLVANPPERAKMSLDDLARAQEKADKRMREHWRVESGVLVFDGDGDSLCTGKNYRDFELWVDWKILKDGDSGIYLRGSPQVQIWDDPVGSGGLYNNKENPSEPSHNADRPIGEWNRFQILMQGDKVTVFLNDELIVHDVTMENYWERDKPIYPTGQIELQNHGNTLYFKNVYVRELPRQ